MAVTAQDMVALYMEAEAALVQGGKDVQFNGRRVVMADLPQIRQGRMEWERRVAAQQRGSRSGHSLAVF